MLYRVTTMMDLLSETAQQKEPPILTGALEEVPDAPDNFPASKPFSDLQAQLCPSALYCCLPRTTTWYSVAIANLTPVEWQKDAIEALVMAGNTKQTLCDLVEEHKRGRLEGALSDFIANKGQVHTSSLGFGLELTYMRL
jgi:hypothetical protein